MRRHNTITSLQKRPESIHHRTKIGLNLRSRIPRRQISRKTINLPHLEVMTLYSKNKVIRNPNQSGQHRNSWIGFKILELRSQVQQTWYIRVKEINRCQDQIRMKMLSQVETRQVIKLIYKVVTSLPLAKKRNFSIKITSLLFQSAQEDQAKKLQQMLSILLWHSSSLVTQNLHLRLVIMYLQEGMSHIRTRCLHFYRIKSRIVHSVNRIFQGLEATKE